MPNVGLRAGYETTKSHDASRRCGGVSALGWRAAEGDAGNRLPRKCDAWPVRTVCGRLPPGTKRNGLHRGKKTWRSNIVGRRVNLIGCPHWPPISSAVKS